MSNDQQNSVDVPEEDDGVLPVGEHVEEVAGVDGKKVRHRGIYLLPNLFTTMALFCGYYAVIAGMQHRFDNAAIAIFVAMIFDGLDGRVARLTNTQSAFGVQYDSLSDMVSFGVAPGLVMFNWALVNVGKFGWSAAFLYCACAALRLARFNTQVETADKRYFTGLASPLAAAIIASMVWAGFDNRIPGREQELAIAIAVITVIAAFLMVSNFRYYSFKELDRSRVPFVVMLPVVLVFAIINYDLPIGLLTVSMVYALSGPVATLWGRLRAAKASPTQG